MTILKTMILTRTLDKKILGIQRQGRIGPYVPCSGEEAAMVASAHALERKDWMISSYRELGAHLARGTSIDLILAQLFGNRHDLLKGRQMSNSWGNKDLNIVPTAAPIGAYLPLAVGIGMGARIKKNEIAVLAYLGDGGTSSADFHSSMNFAGVFHAPIVFLCRNNGWAISVPVSKQTASRSISIKAIAYGFEGIQINGNDAVAVFETTLRSLEKARSGGGPTFIEAVTYRTGPHSTADDPSRYRDEVSSVDRGRKGDPIGLLRKRLVERNLWNEKLEEEVTSDYEDKISEAILRQESLTPLSRAELIFDDVYSSLPWVLREQRTTEMEFE